MALIRTGRPAKTLKPLDSKGTHAAPSAARIFDGPGTRRDYTLLPASVPHVGTRPPAPPGSEKTARRDNLFLICVGPQSAIMPPLSSPGSASVAVFDVRRCGLSS